jgi:hypothetical protein
MRDNIRINQREKVNMITVYQIQMNDTMIDYINDFGRAEAFKEYPQYLAYSDLSIGAERWKDNMVQHFTKVAEIDCDDLEDAFHISNTYQKDKITMIADRMRSLSVGDICVENGAAYLVDGCGFERVDVSMAA